jgi:hypothetical protein
VFCCQCLGQRLFHHTFQRRKTVEVVSQSIVFHQSPVFSLEQFNDGEITVVDQFGSMEHFSAVVFVPLTLVFNDFFWDAQSNVTVVTSPIALIALRVLLDGMDFVVEKPRCFCLGVRNQGFGF